MPGLVYYGFGRCARAADLAGFSRFGQQARPGKVSRMAGAEPDQNWFQVHFYKPSGIA